MARLTNFSKSYLGLVETGRRSATVEIVTAYENELGPIGDDDMVRRDITHPRVLKVGKRSLTDLAAAIRRGEPAELATTPTSRTADFFLAAKLDETGRDYLRQWMTDGTATLRTNALAVLSKMSIPSDIEPIIHVLENDAKVQHLSLASEVSKLTQWDWDTSKAVARDTSMAPEPQKLAKQLTKEAINDKDAECRWCGSHLLARLTPVLGR